MWGTQNFPFNTIHILLSMRTAIQMNYLHGNFFQELAQI